MLRDANGFSHVYLAAGKTDLRKGARRSSYDNKE